MLVSIEQLKTATPSQRTELLKQLIHRCNTSLKNMGPTGQLFLTAFEKTGATEHIWQDSNVPVAFFPDGSRFGAAFLSYSLDEGFHNKILHNLYDYHNYADFFKTRVQEMMHAIQCSRIPALHVTNSNPFSDISLTPRDYITMELIIERVAHFIELYATSYLAVLEPEAFSDSAYADTCARNLPLFKRMLQGHAGQHSDHMASIINRSLLQTGYGSKSWTDFESSNLYRQKLGLPAVQYVRLGEEDIENLSSTLIGARLSGSVLEPPKFSWRDRLLLSGETYYLTGVREKDIPIIRGYLLRDKRSPFEFMAASRSYKPTENSVSGPRLEFL